MRADHLPALPSLLNPLYAPCPRLTRRDELRAWWRCYDRERARSLALVRRPVVVRLPRPAVETEDQVIAERVAA